MEPTLIAVTLLSLSMAVAMGSVAWRLLREERRRSDARVATLSELAGREATAPAPAPPPSAGRIEPLPPAPRSRPIPVRRAGFSPVPSSVPFDLPLRIGTESAPVEALFETRAPATRGGARTLAFALVAAVMATGVWAIWLVGGGARAAASASPMPIELVSLAHDRQDDVLRIS
ncbi:MAG: hypothetical protein ABIG85_04030, partial [Chloroflexota bacterium]